MTNNKDMFVRNNKDTTYRYLIEIIIADNICVQNMQGVLTSKNYNATFTRFIKVELSIQVLSYLTSIVILSDLRLEKGCPRAATVPLM